MGYFFIVCMYSVVGVVILTIAAEVAERPNLSGTETVGMFLIWPAFAVKIIGKCLWLGVKILFT